MSSPADILHETSGSAVFEAPPESQRADGNAAGWDACEFSEEQLCRLVRQLFFPSSARGPRQVVFSAVDRDTDVGGICLQVAETLSAHIPASVGIVEASCFSRDVGARLFPCASAETNLGSLGWTRSASERVSSNLWFVPGPVFWTGGATVGSPAWVRDRLAELRLDFDFTLVHAPPAGLYSGTSLLAQASDGLVLVVEAGITRRITAVRAKEALQAANVRLLGTVLSGRTFPIPEGIYRRI
jgi:hypothetical protein